jgi:small nuclear ribonucleoprotein (snRNP)-like protein
MDIMKKNLYLCFLLITIFNSSCTVYKNSIRFNEHSPEEIQNVTKNLKIGDRAVMKLGNGERIRGRVIEFDEKDITLLKNSNSKNVNCTKDSLISESELKSKGVKIGQELTIELNIGKTVKGKLVEQTKEFIIVRSQSTSVAHPENINYRFEYSQIDRINLRMYSPIESIDYEDIIKMKYDVSIIGTIASNAGLAGTGIITIMGATYSGGVGGFSFGDGGGGFGPM